MEQLGKTLMDKTLSNEEKEKWIVQSPEYIITENHFNRVNAILEGIGAATRRIAEVRRRFLIERPWDNLPINLVGLISAR